MNRQKAHLSNCLSNPQGHRNTPLIWHTYRSNHKIVRLLIEKGADVNANVDAIGTPDLKITALDVAQAISRKQNMDENSMQTFITIRQAGGVTYKQWEGEERIAEYNQRLQSA
jgi:ankyrin repeat protein